jgi:uncharacterized protein (DUF736 family)
MTTHYIDTLLPGPIGPAFETYVAERLPITLRHVERSCDRAPDYRIEAAGRGDVGIGWSSVASKSGIPYIALFIELAIDRHISGMAFPSPQHDGRWVVQFHRISTIRFRS